MFREAFASTNTWEPIFEGSYIEDDCIPISSSDSNHVNVSDSIERGITNPAYQNYTQQSFHIPQHPQNPAYAQRLQQDHSYSQYNYTQYMGVPPPIYTVHQNDATLRNGPSAQQNGQRVVTHPQVFGGQQPPVMIVQPSIMEDPPNDCLAYSIFVTFCCCWLIGLAAIVKSGGCRSAIAAGNRELAEEKSRAARYTAHSGLALGIFLYVFIAVLAGFRVIPLNI